MRAAELNGWKVVGLEPGVVIAEKRKGRHAAQVDIKYDRDSFDITYRNSAVLKYDGQNIHKLYNLWVEGLETSIRREVAAQ